MSEISQLVSLLEDNQTIKISPVGHSMCPFILGGRDYVYLAKPSSMLKRCDIALFQRPDGTQVVHRIHHRYVENSITMYMFMGDNQTWLEGPIPHNEILAVVSKIERKGRLIDCNRNRFYRFMAGLWLILRPLRPVILKLFS